MQWEPISCVFQHARYSTHLGSSLSNWTDIPAPERISLRIHHHQILWKTKKPLSLTPVREPMSQGLGLPHSGSGSDLTAHLHRLSHLAGSIIAKQISSVQVFLVADPAHIKQWLFFSIPTTALTRCTGPTRLRTVKGSNLQLSSLNGESRADHVHATSKPTHQEKTPST